MGYRFGFQGQEKDDEVFNASGTSYTAEFWQYDSRLGRRWNRDPKPNPSISEYATFAGNPIMYSDPKGDTIKFDKNLTEDQLTTIKGDLSFLREDKSFDKLYNKLQASTEVFSVGEFRKVGKANGYFRSSTKEISINNLADIGGRTSTIAEEFFHAYQYDFYGESEFNSLRRTTSLETEAKFFKSQLSGNRGISINSLIAGKRSPVNNFAESTEAANYVQFLKSTDGYLNQMDIKVITDFSVFYKQQHKVVNSIGSYKKLTVPSDDDPMKLRTGAAESLYR